MSSQDWELEREDPRFPEGLLDLSRPPERLYGRGDLGILSEPSLSVVGARRATPYGQAVSEMVGRIAADCGIVVVSGGAMGCDHAVARAALDAGGRTIVVSGCGADRVYPVSSSDVFADAVMRGGAVVSIETWGFGPRRYAFPKRNAVIAALSQSLMVVEAGAKSGTMSTADAAVELGRTVYAIPGSIFSPNSSGTNRLIAEGARMIPDEPSLELSLSLDYGIARLSGGEGGDRPQGRVMSALVASPSRPDELAERLNEDVLTLLHTLTDYELRGIVVKLPDGRYSPTREYFKGEN
ncbi:MAG: DNA-processing protein DprA [Olsenella sp.]